MLRTVSILLVAMLVGLLGGCTEKLYRPCQSSAQCLGEDDDLHCVVSPYDGDADGFCTKGCQVMRPEAEAGDCIGTPQCGGWAMEGCCYLSHAGRGFASGVCVPFPPEGTGDL